MTTARTIATEIAASATEYHAIGPFTTAELLAWLIIQLSAESEERVLIAPVVHATPTATAATIAAGYDIIQQADTQLSGANALNQRCGATAVSTVIVPIGIQQLSSPTWVHLAIGNLNAAHTLYLTASVTTHHTPGTAGPLSAQPPPTPT